MEQEVLLKNGSDLVYLARCALAGETPKDENLKRMDLEAVHALARKHSMAAISAYAVESYCKENPDSSAAQHPVIHTWRQDKAQAIRKNLMLDMEREKILAHLEQIGCWYMPMKGVFMQHVYPKAGMRQMSDNDILIDAAYRKAVQEYMEQNGYESHSVGESNHDEYLKNPVYNFEMHVALLAGAVHRTRAAYYEAVRERLIKDPDNACGYHFTDEDFYIYMHVHAAKHFEACGNGIRSLMDVYQYLSQKGETLDRDYINQELEKLELTEYVRAMELLSRKLFEETAPLTEEERQLFLYHVSSGTYGTWVGSIDNGIKKYASKDGKVTIWSKLHYILRRLYPAAEFYQYSMPLVYQYRILMPFAAFWRLIVRLFSRFDAIAEEVKNIFKRKS